MNPAPYRVRRATIDDLAALKSLREVAHQPAEDLEKRLTEFQVVEDAAGKIVAALGFTMHQRHGLIYSEAFQEYSLADQVRPLFWTRIQSLTLNHGIARLWTNENSPFWTRNGFQPANEQAIAKLPAPWAKPGSNWFTLQLKDEEAVASIEKEIDAWMRAERNRTAQRLETAKTLKVVVTILGIIIFIGAMAGAFYVWAKKNSLPPPH